MLFASHIKALAFTDIRFQSQLLETKDFSKHKIFRQRLRRFPFLFETIENNPKTFLSIDLY